MKRKDWFVVGVQLLGVWLLIGFVDEARLLLEFALGWARVGQISAAGVAVHGGVDLLIGLYLLAGAPILTLLAFGKRDEHSCERCGYDIRATPDRCPECGHVPAV
jgi:hypothetical protein